MIGRLIKGFGFSSGIALVTLVVQLVAVPVYLIAWGPGVYGEWLVLTNLAASISILNLGVQSHTGNQMIEAYVTGNLSEGTRALQGALRLYLVLCGIALAAMLALALWPGTLLWLKVNEIQEGSARLIIVLYGVLATYSIFGGVLLGILRAINQYPRQLAYSFVERLIVLVSPLAIAWAGGPPLYAATAVTGLMLLVALVALRDVAKRTPFVIGISRSSWTRSGMLVRPSMAFFGVSMASTMLSTGMLVILSNGNGAQAVAVFSVTLMLTNLVRLVLQQGLSVLWPEITAAASDPARVSILAAWHRLCLKAGCAFALASAIAVWLLGPEILSKWIAGKIDVDAALNMLLALHLVIQAPALVSSTFGLAIGKQESLFVVQILTSVIALVLAWCAIPYLGARGAAVGLIIGQLASTLWTVKLACGWVEDAFANFARDVIARGMPLVGVAALAAATFAYASPGLIARIAVVLCIAVAVLAGLWITWMTGAERARIANMLKMSDLVAS